MRCAGFPGCGREWERGSGKRGLLEARPPRHRLGEAGSLPSLREMLTAPRSKRAQLLSCRHRPRGNGTVTERAFTPHPCSPQARGREERMAARRRFVAPRVPQLFGPSKKESFTGAGGWSSVENLAPRLPPPIFGIFSAVRSRQGAGQRQSFLLELCAVRGLLSAATFFSWMCLVSPSTQQNRESGCSHVSSLDPSLRSRTPVISGTGYGATCIH